MLTQEGGTLYVTGKIELGGISNSVSMANFNGGICRPHSILCVTNLFQMAGASGQYCDFLKANNPSYVNFNGGTYAPTLGDWLTSWLDPNVTRYTVYAGGATVDIGKIDRELFVPFEAPVGMGVAAVPFKCAEPWRYLGAPYVKIVDPSGAGFGASAAADFDSASGTVTGVTVTSPGCNYGEGTYAEISFGGWTNTVCVAVTLAANATTGGFTKKGTGRLSVISTNTFGGVTRVAEGTLALAADDALPRTSGVAIDAGATFDRAGHAFISSGTLAGCGTFKGDYTLAGTFTLAAADIIASRGLAVEGRLTIAPGTRFVVTDAGALPEKMHHVRILSATDGISGTLTLDPATFADGKYDLISTATDIRFGATRGLVVLFR